MDFISISMNLKNDVLYFVFVHRNQNGDRFVRLNENEVPLDKFHKVVQTNAERRKNELKKMPFIRYESLTAKEIKTLLSGSKPIHIFMRKNLSMKYDENYYDYHIVFNYTGVDGMHSVGAKGNGVGLFFEEGCPDASVINQNFFIQFDSCTSPSSHATKVARLLQLTAPEATVVNFTGFGQSSLSVVAAVDNYADLFNPKLEIGSYSWHYDNSPCENDSYCVADQDLDQHIYENRLIYFVAAGNMDDVNDISVGSPGKALNAITVGAVNSHTGAYINQSKWENSEIGNQKPEIANYTNIDLDFSYGWINGTSASTPYSAAIAANVLSIDSGLKRHPEVIKAMFLMNATIPISDGYSYDSDDWTYVSSKLPYFDVNVAFRYRWWSGPNASFFNNDDKIIFTETGVSSGQHCRAAISWLTSGLYAGVYKMLAQDIDLYVYQGSTNPIASSANSLNPFEVVDFITQSNADLRFEIERYANSLSDNVILGFTMRCVND